MAYGCFISTCMLKNTDFFSNFPLIGSMIWGILLAIPLEFQEIKHQPFPMAQLGCVVVLCVTI